MSIGLEESNSDWPNILTYQYIFNPIEYVMVEPSETLQIICFYARFMDLALLVSS